MGFWAWFAIWCTLAVIAVGVLGFIGYELMGKMQSNLHQLERLEKQVAPLIKATKSREAAPRPSESLLSPAETFARRKGLIRAREQKAQDRQRRLIARLKDFKPQESRFK